MKILYYTDSTDVKMEPIRVWTLLGLTLASCVTLPVSWKMMTSSKRSIVKRRLNGNSTDSEQGSSEEKESLLSENSDEDSESSDDENINMLGKNESGKFTAWQAVIKLLKLSKNDICYILLALLFMTMCSIAEIFLPYFTGQVIDYIVIEKSVEKFKQAIMYMALLTLFAGFVAGTRDGLLIFVSGRYILQNLLFARIMRMEIGFFDVRKTGEITSRLTSDCTKIGDGIRSKLNIFLRNVVKIIGILFFMIKISWKLSIVTLVTISVIAIISEAFGEKYRKLAEQVQDSLAHANESAEEAVSSMRTVRSFAAETNEIDRYSMRLKKTYELCKKDSILGCGYRWSTELTDLVTTILILYYGGYLVLKNELSGGKLVSFILYSIDIGYTFEEIGDVYTGLIEAVGASKIVMAYIDREPRISNNGLLSPDSIDGEIEFKNVSFAYPSREDIPVLKKLNFTAKKGEIVALVGPSGGGKTSIVNLLEHFYEPSEGKILIDKTDLIDYDHKFIHQKISLVQQEPLLFARTISENIAYGLSFKANKEELKKCCFNGKCSQLH